MVQIFCGPALSFHSGDDNRLSLSTPLFTRDDDYDEPLDEGEDEPPKGLQQETLMHDEHIQVKGGGAYRK